MAALMRALRDSELQLDVRNETSVSREAAIRMERPRHKRWVSAWEAGKPKGATEPHIFGEGGPIY